MSSTPKAGEVKVLGAWPSPFVMRPRIALNVKSVDYEFIEETMNPKSELLLKSNPIYKKIPVLFHNDKPICESLVIVHYIDEAWPSGPSILPPDDAFDRATARFWAAYIDDKFFPALSGIAKAQDAEGKASSIEQVKESLATLEDAYVKCSKGKPFFGGDEIGYLDIAFGCFLAWMRVSEKANNMVLLDDTKLPGLTAWAHRFCQHPAVKNVMPDTDKLMEFSKVLMARLKAAAAAAAGASSK